MQLLIALIQIGSQWLQLLSLVIPGQQGRGVVTTLQVKGLLDLVLRRIIYIRLEALSKPRISHGITDCFDLKGLVRSLVIHVDGVVLAAHWILLKRYFIVRLDGTCLRRGETTLDRDAALIRVLLYAAGGS